MDELRVSASDFRVHFKDLANSVATGEQRVLIARHGYWMAALVSHEDLQFLRKHRPGTEAAARAQAGIPERLEHPDNMETEEIERIYQATEGTTDERVQNWRGNAFLVLGLRTGKHPEKLPWTPPCNEGS